MKGIQWISAVLLLLPFTAQPMAAQGGCKPDKVVNLVAVQFVTGKERIPPAFTLTSTSNPRLQITVSDQGDGTWTCPLRQGLVGREQELKPDLKIPGYSIKSVRGTNRMLGGGCYAFFKFKVEKVAWALEVTPNPRTFPFKFQKNSGDYEPRSPDMKDWQVVKGLTMDDRINLKIYEIRRNKPLYLFDLDGVSPKEIASLTQDEISERILEARRRHWLGTQNDDLDPEDPYLEIAKGNNVGANAISANLARMLIKAELKGLELKDKLEENQ
jgi:hypothetical protein